MCFAILKVTYQHNSLPVELVKAPYEADLESLLKKYQNMELVDTISVFKLHHTFARTTSWITTNHA